MTGQNPAETPEGLDVSRIVTDLRAVLETQPAEARAAMLAGIIAALCLADDPDLDAVINHLIAIYNGDEDAAVTFERTTLQ